MRTLGTDLGYLPNLKFLEHRNKAEVLSVEPRNIASRILRLQYVPVR